MEMRDRRSILESTDGGDVSLLVPAPGHVLALESPPGFGLTRLALEMMARVTVGPVVSVDARGWFSPLGAWEAGVDPERLVVVRCSDPVRWARTVAALLDGIDVVHAEVPEGVGAAALRRLAARARSRGTSLLLRPLRGRVPTGIAHLRVEALSVRWDGLDRGHGRLRRRWITLRISGKAVGGTTRTIEIEDDGTNALRVVPGLAVTAPGRAAG